MSATVNCALETPLYHCNSMQYFFLLQKKKYWEVVRVFLLGSIQIFALDLVLSCYFCWLQTKQTKSSFNSTTLKFLIEEHVCFRIFENKIHPARTFLVCSLIKSKFLGHPAGLFQPARLQFFKNLLLKK